MCGVVVVGWWWWGDGVGVRACVRAYVRVGGGGGGHNLT